MTTNPTQPPARLVTDSAETLAGAIAASNGWTNWTQHEFRQAEHLIASGAVRPAAEVRAEAWDEGYEACIDDTEARSAPPGPNGPVDPTPNPNRTALDGEDGR